MLKSVREAEIVPFGIGCYTAPEAARLLRTKPRTISRWLGGYTYRSRGETLRAEPLWTPQWPREGESIEIGFNDLIELRFVLAFLDKGVALNVIRRCQESARAIFADERPFSNHRFRTDGRRVFLETAREFADTSEGATSGNYPPSC